MRFKLACDRIFVLEGTIEFELKVSDGGLAIFIVANDLDWHLVTRVEFVLD